MFFQKFCAVIAVFFCMQLSAMEQEVLVVESVKMVRGVALQVHPGYVTGTKLFSRLSGTDAAKHEQVVSKISTACNARSLSPVKDLGVYCIEFKEPVALATVQLLCQELPGFEKVYDVEEFQDEVSTLKEAVYEHRLNQLDKVNKLRLLKKLSISRLIVPGQEQLIAQ